MKQKGKIMKDQTKIVKVFLQSETQKTNELVDQKQKQREKRSIESEEQERGTNVLKIAYKT